uniref:C-type lectin domain-containing protein n=1 Tax=Sander lucioperca TaxID=283035 RepID=A0A8D0DB80_SANLU
AVVTETLCFQRLKMKSWFCWILILFRNVSAAEHCSPAGVLTTLATEQEVTNVLKVVAVAAAAPRRGEFTFWIGLRKLKDGCVVPTLPLRGFKWTKDGSEESQVSRWAEEPKHTCTTTLCAALKGELDGSNVTRWGLIPFSCRMANNFICKLTNAEQKPNQQKPDPEKEPTASGTPQPDTQPTKLRCSGWPAVWRLKDDSPANFTDICASCDAGFQKDASGNCMDVDECIVGRPCRHSCLNTVGSYRCFCSDQSGNQHSEDSPECAEAATSGVLMVALVAVAALVVLVLVVVVTVKCCLMRQSKKRAMKKAEKMAMDSKDSFETANEKAAT